MAAIHFSVAVGTKRLIIVSILLEDVSWIVNLYPQRKRTIKQTVHHFTKKNRKKSLSEAFVAFLNGDNSRCLTRCHA